MKKILFLLAMLPMMIACSHENDSSTNNTISGAVDEISAYLSKMDSINNSGRLSHLVVHKIGKFKNIDIEVLDLESGGVHLYCINLKKDVSSSYYSNIEEARIVKEEVKYLQQAVNTIAISTKRKVETKEMYSYITKDDFRVYASAEDKNYAWLILLDMNYKLNKREYYTIVSEDELFEFMSLINKGEQKIDELTKQAGH